MPLRYSQLRACLQGERLPAALVDLDALDRNLERILGLIRPSGKPLRVASKSVRVVHLLRYLLDHGQGLCRGVMCFSAEEAELLARRGFDDLLIAYPPQQQPDLDRLARLTGEGVLVSVASDCREGLDRLSAAGARHGVRLKVVLDCDMSLRLGGGLVRLGVWRSPLHTPRQVVDLARYAARRPGLELYGLLAYEAQVAGLGDDSPFEPLTNPLMTLVKRASLLQLSRRRAAMVQALRAAGLAPKLVNGGGSGSLDTTPADPAITEVTAGSAFFKPHLFDYYKNPHMKALEPACFFALEVTRQPAPGLVTCLGGGYVASGPAGRDKIPLPYLPAGLSLLPDELAGEVQTPLRLPAGLGLELGAPVIFRHAKAGELAERFREYLLVRGGAVVDRVPTYRGEGCCFF